MSVFPFHEIAKIYIITKNVLLSYTTSCENFRENKYFRNTIFFATKKSAILVSIPFHKKSPLFYKFRQVLLFCNKLKEKSRYVNFSRTFSYNSQATFKNYFCENVNTNFFVCFNLSLAALLWYMYLQCLVSLTAASQFLAPYLGGRSIFVQ